MENNIEAAKLTPEQIKEITAKVTDNYNNNKGITITKISKGNLEFKLNDELYDLNEREIDTLRLFLDSIYSTYHVLKNKNE